jgi:hypothetical protein
MGGATESQRQAAIGPSFKSQYDPATGSMTMPTGANDVERYAKILGGALTSSDRAVGTDLLSSLNAGNVNRLPTATELKTMLPSEQNGIYSLMQQMGLGNVKDLQAQVKAFTPVALGAS